MGTLFYNMRLTETRKNLTANLERPPNLGHPIFPGIRSLSFNLRARAEFRPRT